MLIKSILAALLLVFIPTNAHADGCTENCVVEINCTTGEITMRYNTPDEIIAHDITIPREPVIIDASVSATPMHQPPVSVDTTPIVYVNPAKTTPEPTAPLLTARPTSVVIDISSNTTTTKEMTNEEIIELWFYLDWWDWSWVALWDWWTW